MNALTWVELGIGLSIFALIASAQSVALARRFGRPLIGFLAQDALVALGLGALLIVIFGWPT